MADSSASLMTSWRCLFEIASTVEGTERTLDFASGCCELSIQRLRVRLQSLLERTETLGAFRNTGFCASRRASTSVATRT
jgi:hypothetical protein